MAGIPCAYEGCPEDARFGVMQYGGDSPTQDLCPQHMGEFCLVLAEGFYGELIPASEVANRSRKGRKSGPAPAPEPAPEPQAPFQEGPPDQVEDQVEDPAIPGAEHNS